MRVLGRKVVIQPDPLEFQGVSERVKKALDQGKLVLPESYEGEVKKLSPKGTVLGVGLDCKYGLKVGDRVFYGAFSFEKLSSEIDSPRIVLEEDIHCVVDD